MNVLSVENVSRSYGLRVLFKDISFGLEDGDKVALVARNGAGKSTLLNILSGKDTPDSGRVSLRNGMSMGILAQDPQFDPEKTVIETALLTGSDLAALVRDYESQVELCHTDHSDAAQTKLHDLMTRMDTMNA